MSFQNTSFDGAEDSELSLLLLAGGLSTRMGQPKHLLQLPNGRLLFIHIIHQVKSVLPALKTCYISLRKGSADLSTTVSAVTLVGIDIRIVYDDDEQETSPSQLQEASSLGPAAGMYAAHKLKPKSKFLVVACDFPLLTPETIALLLKQYQDPITCYQNAEGFCEPLLGVWSPAALQKLCENMQRGVLAPSKVIKQLNARTIFPPVGCEQWLYNTNTNAEWHHAVTTFSSQ